MRCSEFIGGWTALSCFVVVGCAVDPAVDDLEVSSVGCRPVVSASEALDIAITHLNIDRNEVYVDGSAIKGRDGWAVFLDFDPPAPGNHQQVWIDFCGNVTGVIPGA